MESFLEYRGTLSTPAIDRWGIPNPFVIGLMPYLTPHGVGLADLSFNADAKTLAEMYLNISLRKFNGAIKVFPEKLEISLLNPNWDIAPTLVPLFDSLRSVFQYVGGQTIGAQEITVALHVTHGDVDVDSRMKSLVNTAALGPAKSYGFAAYRDDGYISLERSVRHNAASFIRINRRYIPSLNFAEMAKLLYGDEIAVLGLIGIEGIA
ncbi:MAG TPA: hypothetical protein VGE93_12205 [Bryobacteraceae bacterium]